MKITRTLIILSLLLCGPTAFAHGGHDGPAVTVGGVETGDRDSLNEFVEHAATHLGSAASFTEALDLLYSFRDETGDWNDGTVYLILLTTKGGVYIHPKNREYEDQDWSDFNLVRTGFVPYGDGNYAYSHRFQAPFIPFANPDAPEFVLVGGFTEEPPVKPVTTGASCEDLFAEYGLINLCPSIPAGKVEDLDDLKVFLDEARHFFTNAFVSPDIDPVILRRLFRLEGGPWREGATYIWIQSEMGRAVFNAVNRNIEQQNLWEEVDDDGDLYVQDLINAAGSSGIGEGLEYNWENPLVEGDGEGEGPGGSSSKLGYAIRIPVPLEGETKADTRRVYIFGSGIYPLSKEDNGGCAVTPADKAAGFPISILLIAIGVLFIRICSTRLN